MYYIIEDRTWQLVQQLQLPCKQWTYNEHVCAYQPVKIRHFMLHGEELPRECSCLYTQRNKCQCISDFCMIFLPTCLAGECFMSAGPCLAKLHIALPISHMQTSPTCISQPLFAHLVTNAAPKQGQIFDTCVASHHF